MGFLGCFMSYMERKVFTVVAVAVAVAAQLVHLFAVAEDTALSQDKQRELPL
jgi:hypothetical protein